MNRILLRAWFGVFIFACVLGLALSRHSAMVPANAGTPTPLPSASAVPTASSTTAPNTNITNAASATYSDGTNTYTILSNTVTVVVQNAPAVVVITDNGTSVGTTSGQIYPGDSITELYTIVNTGNGSGNFTLASAAQASPTPLPGLNGGSGVSSGVADVTTASYDVSCSGGSGLNDVSTSLSTINTDLQNAACKVNPGGSVNIAVTYMTNATGSSAQTSAIEAQVSYAAVGGVAAASSLWVTNDYNETVVADERVDIQKSPAPMATDGTETYQITVNNGGYGNANYVTSYGACPNGSFVRVCGPALAAAGGGMLISDKVPVNASGTPLPVVTLIPSPGPMATPAGTTASVVYTTDNTAATGWTVASSGFPAGTRYVGLYLSGSGYALAGDPTPGGGADTAPGAVPTGKSQIGFSVKIGPVPGGVNVYNFITAPVGDNKTTPCIEGPGLTTAAESCDANGGNPTPGGTASPGNPGIPLATPTPAASLTPGPGLSNLANLITPTLYNGPNNAPSAQGCFNAAATPAPFPALSPNPFPTLAPTTLPTCSTNNGSASNNDDYSQAVMTPAPAQSPAYAASPSAGNGLTVTVQNSITNPNTSGTPVPIQLNLQYVSGGLNATPTVTYGDPASPSCATHSATYSSGYWSLGNLPSNNQQVNYCVTYTTTAGAGAPYFFQPLFADLRVSSTIAPSLYYNDTWNVLMPGGFVEIVKQNNVLTIAGNPGSCTGTAGGTLPTPPANPGICPGGIIQYAIAYVNTLPVASSGSTPEPASATLTGVSGNFTITEDGAQNGSNWATYTNGLYDPAGTPPASVLQKSMTYATMLSNCGKVTVSCGDTNTSATFTGNTVGSTHFTDVIPGASITPQSVGELVFAVQVH